MSDPINHPPHYTRGKIEVATFILDQQLPWTLGNAVAYICRAGHKPGNPAADDLKKAVRFLAMEIQELEHVSQVTERP